jgi:hypothetical protein
LAIKKSLEKCYGFVQADEWCDYSYLQGGQSSTHIYGEGNQVADSLANHGLSIASITFWNETPFFITDYVNRNKLGMPVLDFVPLNGVFGFSPLHCKYFLSSSLIYFGEVST